MGATVRKTATNAKGSAKKSNKDKLDISFGLPEPVLAFIQDASMRLSMAPAKLKVAIAATRLEPRVFGIIEAIVQANQDETQEQRLKQSAEALRPPAPRGLRLRVLPPRRHRWVFLWPGSWS